MFLLIANSVIALLIPQPTFHTQTAATILHSAAFYRISVFNMKIR